MTPENNRKFKGVWIAKRIWDADLTPLQLHIWANVDTLSDEDESEPCVAKNEWLAARMKTTPGTIAVELSALRKLGYIKDVSTNRKDRKLYAVFPPRKAVDSLTGINEKPDGSLTGANELDEQALTKPAEHSTTREKVQRKGTPPAVADAPVSDTSFEADSGPENGKTAPKVNDAPEPTNGHRASKFKASELSDGRHAQFIADWSGEFQGFFGSPYAFCGGRDGKAVKELLRVADVPTVIATAKRAWAGEASEFLAQRAATIHGLLESWNEITVALARKVNGRSMRPVQEWTSADLLKRNGPG